jgi:hypothetical protein
MEAHWDRRRSLRLSCFGEVVVPGELHGGGVHLFFVGASLAEEQLRHPRRLVRPSGKHLEFINQDFAVHLSIMFTGQDSHLMVRLKVLYVQTYLKI